MSAFDNDNNDFANSPVPLEKRRGPLTMGLLWITMVTAFPSFLMGFEWFKQGLGFWQVVSFTILGSFILLLYSVPAAYLGAKSGQTYGMLSRQVFGRWGSRLVTCNLLWLFVCFYAFFAFLLADTLNDILQLHWPIMPFAAAIAILMAFNNFFGFSGVANFARFLAAPLIIATVGYTFFKVMPAFWGSGLPSPAMPASFSTALVSVSGFVIGFAIWGNEPDYWRFGKPKAWLAIAPMALALCIGQVIFPVTGWMVASLSAVADSAGATGLITTYSFGGIAWLAAMVFTAIYFASNDSCLYGMINAVENLKTLPHNNVCGVLALLGAVLAAVFSLFPVAQVLESLASLNCVFMPTATVIMMVEYFIVRPKANKPADFSTIVSLESLPALEIPGICALLAGYACGIATAGVIPGTDSLHVGLCSINAWLAATAVYVPLRLRQLTMEIASLAEFTVGEQLSG